jgi:glycosyltransferase involved in cell wall biosynthesis
LIVPSRAEGFGFITAEGMFSGALVIGKNVRGTKEQFDNGNTETGQEIAIRYETEAELTQYLAEVSQNGIEPYLTMIQAGQHTAVQLYSIESHQNAVWDLYCEIVKKETR